METLIHKCIDKYIQKRVQIYESERKEGGMVVDIDPKMENVINKMFDRCY